MDRLRVGRRPEPAVALRKHVGRLYICWPGTHELHSGRLPTTVLLLFQRHRRLRRHPRPDPRPLHQRRLPRRAHGHGRRRDPRRLGPRAVQHARGPHDGAFGCVRGDVGGPEPRAAADDAGGGRVRHRDDAGSGAARAPLPATYPALPPDRQPTPGAIESQPPSILPGSSLASAADTRYPQPQRSPPCTSGRTATAARTARSAPA